MTRSVFTDVGIGAEVGDSYDCVSRAAKDQAGAVRLTAAPQDRARLREALLTLAAEPVEAGFLHLHPTVVAVAQDPRRLPSRSISARCCHERQPSP